MKTLIISFFAFHYLIFTFHLSEAQIIHVPADYPAIQQAIDASDHGDTVLVSPGKYVENISFQGKNITVASLFLTSYDTAYISQTIIYGDSDNTVVNFYENDSTTRLTGFTITNGGYGGIRCWESSPLLSWLTVTENSITWEGGGGISCSFGKPVIENSTIKNNVSIRDFLFGGHAGGIWLECDHAILRNVIIRGNKAQDNCGGLAIRGSVYMENVTITGNEAMNGGGLCTFDTLVAFDNIHRCNIYNNHADLGNDFYALNLNAIVHLILDTCTVMLPSPYHAWPAGAFSFDILHSIYPQAEADLYVSPAGDNSNSGVTAAEPLKNIDFAVNMIIADSLSPRTIHLAEGRYSPSSNGEFFPLRLPDHVHLAGSSAESVILDAEGTGQVIRLYGNHAPELSGFTVTGGYSSADGGGIWIRESDPVISHVNFQGNHADRYGGGIYCVVSSPDIIEVSFNGNSAGIGGGGICCYNQSDPVLRNVRISENSASWSGGGLLSEQNSEPVLKNVTISGNSANMGGGIAVRSSSYVAFDPLDRCSVYMNDAGDGRDIWREISPLDPNPPVIHVTLDTFTVLKPTSLFASPMEYLRFDILHGKISQIESDVYVSPSGNDANDGLTPQTPLKTIRAASLRIFADSLHPRTMHLQDGTYSPSNTGETFPVLMTDYVSLEGGSADDVILDAEGTASGIMIYQSPGVSIRNLTVTGGNLGGIYCQNASPQLENLVVRSNYGVYSGGGILLWESDALLRNMIIENNRDEISGGGIFMYESRPLLQNVVISGNSAPEGGGVYIDRSYAYPLFINTTISGNHADSGAIIQCSKFGARFHLINTILWNDPVPEIILTTDFSGVSVEHSAIRGGESGIIANDGTIEWLEGNIDLDPMFSGEGEHPFALQSSSPCIDAGTPDTSPLSLPDYDLIGNQRVWDGNGDGSHVIDMGAYEYGEPATFLVIMPDLASCLNDSLVLEAQAAGIPPIYYQWHKNDMVIPGAIDATLIIPSAQPTDEGEYTCLVRNGYGKDTSNVALLDVIEVVPSEITGITEVVEEESVQYSVNVQEGHQYVFSVTGGTITSSTENTVTVQWGNPGVGYINLDETEEHGCEAETVAVEVEVYISGLGIESAVGGQQSAVTCFPNPTHSSIEFRVSSIQDQRISLKVYDVHGRDVATVLDGRWYGGEVVWWDASGLPAGIYFYQLRAKGVGLLGAGKIVKQ